MLSQLVCFLTRSKRNTPELTQKGCVLPRVSKGVLYVTIVLGMSQSIDALGFTGTWRTFHQSTHCKTLLASNLPNLHSASHVSPHSKMCHQSPSPQCPQQIYSTDLLKVLLYIFIHHQRAFTKIGVNSLVKCRTKQVPSGKLV